MNELPHDHTRGIMFGGHGGHGGGKLYNDMYIIHLTNDKDHIVVSHTVYMYIYVLHVCQDFIQLEGGTAIEAYYFKNVLPL